MRYYRLDASDRGPSFQIAAGFHAGDLLLRPDRTYALVYAPDGAHATIGEFDAGSWQQNGSTLVLRSAHGTSTSCVVTDDSVLIANSDGSMGARFLRSELTGVALPSGTWVLRSIDGHGAVDPSGIVASDDQFADGRFVSRVAYDTLVFSDGLFARDSWAGTGTYTPASGPAQVATQSAATPAIYNATPSRVTIQYLATNSTTPVQSTAIRDTLGIRGDTLIRTVRRTDGSSEYRYVRLR